MMKSADIQKKTASFAIVAGTLLYLFKFLRPYFQDSHAVLFILGFLPNFGLAFAIPFIYVGNRMRLSKPVRHFTAACIVTVVLMILNEVRDIYQAGRVFDWCDIYTSVAGAGLAFLVFQKKPFDASMH